LREAVHAQMAFVGHVLEQIDLSRGLTDSSPDEVACCKFHSIRDLEGKQSYQNNHLKASESQPINLLFYCDILSTKTAMGLIIALDTCQRASKSQKRPTIEAKETYVSPDVGFIFASAQQSESRGLGWRIHGSVEDTKLSTNKQHSHSK
jgi:hypothetical protein